MSNLETLSKINQLMSGLSHQDLMIVAQSASIRARTLVNIEIKIGDEVEFDAKTRGIKRGVLIKKNRKTSKVLVGHTTWTVTSTLLKKAA